MFRLVEIVQVNKLTVTTFLCYDEAVKHWGKKWTEEKVDALYEQQMEDCKLDDCERDYFYWGIMDQMMKNFVGMVSVQYDRFAKGHYLSIYLRKRYRSQGFGSGVLKEVIRKMKSFGKEELNVKIRKGNKIAEALFLKHGFELAIKNYKCGGVFVDCYSLKL